MALFRSNWFLGLLCALFSVPGASQQVQPASSGTVGDATAIAVANRSIAAMTNGIAVHDAMLQGTVQRGTPRSSASTQLIALAGHQSRVDFGPSGTTLRETRTENDGQPRAVTSINNVTTTVINPNRDVWSEAVWFLPVLSLLNSVNDPSIRFTYIDSPTINGSATTHIRAARYVTAADASVNAVIGRLSSADFYISNQTFLPLALSFSSAPDNYTPVGAQHWILFADYTTQQGISYPATINEFVNGSLRNAITITSASFNTGITSVTGN